jgi:hypothetical protein
MKNESEWKPRTTWANVIPGQGETADAARTEQTDERVDFCEVEVMPKPVLADAALYGLLGDITQFITPQTEADPMAIYSQFLVAYGNSIGRKAFFQVEQSRHYTNLFLVLVGVTAKGRKGIALDYVRAFYRQADPFYLPQMIAGCLVGGINLGCARPSARKREGG